jgi:tetratricopeptide (TPR) repeat protein
MSRYEILFLSLLSLLIFCIYSNTLEAPFVFDDYANIQNNSSIRLNTFTIEEIIRAGFKSYIPSRPIANISFALNYYFNKYNTTGYHVVNILIHIITGIFLYLFLKTTLQLPLLRFKSTTPVWIASFTVLIWIVHPLHTQSVTYIVQRMNSLAAMFYILSMLLYVKARLTSDTRQRWVLYAGCTLSGLLALGSKEIALTLPFFFLLYEWYFFRDLCLVWFKRYFFSFAGVVVFLVLAALAYMGTDTLHNILFPAGDFDFTLTQRVLTEFRVVMVYLKLLLFPHPSQLNIDYDFPLSRSFFDPMTTLLALGTIIGVIGLAWYLSKKERLLSFCVLWFFGNLVIESSVVMLDILFEHRTYLPSMLFSLLVVMFVVRAIKLPWLRVVGLCAVALVYAVWTYERNSLWANEVTLWRDCVAKSPHKARPYNNLAYALVRQGNIEEAVRHYTEALRIAPSYALAHNNLGDALSRQGKLTEAVRHYTEALRLRPDYAEAHNNLGNALMDQGQVAEAVRHYTEALRINPNSVLAHNNLGSALAHQGQVAEAVRHYTEALRLNPNYAPAYNNLGNALARQGRVEEAVRHYTEALRLNPNYTQARKNLEYVLRQIGTSADPSRTDSKP